ncbi:MAG: aminoglycoside phosphotransferase family protein [Planctomycetes bacterium]|nr:aminoglycoside phosphotransferase family protein [Planctomycetota bacterium]
MNFAAPPLPTTISLQDVERFDLDRERRLVATVGEAPHQRWFRRELGAWREIRAEDDDALPFVGELRALAARGPVEMLAWKPGRRITLAAMHGTGRAIYKARRRSGHATALEAHLDAQDSTRDSGFLAPALVEQSCDHALLVFEHIAARPLSIDADDLPRYFAIGRALRELQRRTPTHYRAVHGPREEERVLQRMRERTLEIAGDEPAGAEAVFARFQRASSRVRASEPVIAHRDLHDGQLLVRGERLVLLDFDLLCLADSALDPANLAVHLELRALQGLSRATHESSRACAEALFDGLGRNGDDAFHARVLFHRGATFLRLAWVYHVRPRHAALCTELLARAAASFDEFERHG